MGTDVNSALEVLGYRFFPFPSHPPLTFTSLPYKVRESG